MQTQTMTKEDMPPFVPCQPCIDWMTYAYHAKVLNIQIFDPPTPKMLLRKAPRILEISAVMPHLSHPFLWQQI